MNRLLARTTFLLLIFFTKHTLAQKMIDANSIREKMQWFADAKLGIFVHAGIYAVDGVDESWSFYNKKISHSSYMQQLNGFTLSQYNPNAWADLFKEAGARYAVITTKHHDGVAMYDTRLNKLSSVQATPAKKDLIAPLFEALRQRGLKAGAYYSLIDWTHTDYPAFLRDSNRYRIPDDYNRWQRFRQFFQAQVVEINTLFKPDLFWFDGDWEHSAEEWEAAKVRQLILRDNPNAIINSRLQGYGDYETPEQNIPLSKPAYPWWELCMTINDNWGYQHKDNNWKTPGEIISIFTDVVGTGGNLLLDVGPKEDGTIPPEATHVLRELGGWNKRNGEAVFGTLAGIPNGHFYGPTTLSKDSTVLYLFLQGRPTGTLKIKGLANQINSITVLGNGTPLTHKVVGKISWSKVPGLIFIDVPQQALDPYVTVLKLQLAGPVTLYSGTGGL